MWSASFGKVSAASPPASFGPTPPSPRPPWQGEQFVVYSLAPNATPVSAAPLSGRRQQVLGDFGKLSLGDSHPCVESIGTRRGTVHTRQAGQCVSFRRRVVEPR